MSHEITVNGQRLIYVTTDSEIADAEQISDYRDRVGNVIGARHLTFATLDELWGTGAPMVLPVKGEPACRLRLDPKNGLITLATPYDTPEPDVAKLKNVGFTAVSVGDDEVAELTVRVEGSVHGAYGLLATIADELQIERMPLAAAVAAGVARHRNVFASRGVMTTEKEVGRGGFGYDTGHVIYASNRTVANMIYRRHFKGE